MHQTSRGLLLSLWVCASVSACGGDQRMAEGAGGASTAGPSATAGGTPSASDVGTSSTAGAGGAGANAGSGGSTSGSGGAASGGAQGSGGDPGAAGTTAGSGGAPGGSGSAGTGAGGAPVDQGNLPATTLHLAGDSTVMDYGPASAQEGWGQELGQYFISKVKIDNKALGGSSIQTFQSRWTAIVSSLKAGDFVMADFGINDSGSVAGRHVSPADFKTFMSQMDAQARAKQATFILVTPSALQYWSGGVETNARLAPYVAVENSLGMASHIPVDDLNARSLEFLNMIGQAAAAQIYINGDKAHFTKMGATQMAKFVASELKRIGNPLAAYLK